jgi:hypothetical protein
MLEAVQFLTLARGQNLAKQVYGEREPVHLSLIIHTIQ